jgi:phage tail sheath protein FI
MPVTPTYPGVYIEEIPSGVRTITGVATSITAFIGRALRGPVNEPTRIQSFGDFERVFGHPVTGGLWVHSTMSYAVQHFFLNGGADAIIVRVHNGATAASIVLPAGAETLTLQAANVGGWGNNLRAVVDYNTRDAANTNLFNLTIEEVDGSGNAVQGETFRNLSINSDDATFVTTVLGEESSLVQVSGAIPSVRPDAATTNDNGAGDDGNALQDAQIVGSQPNKEGIFALEDADLFNLMCIPPLTRDQDVAIDPTLVAAADYCKDRRAMLIVDPRSNWNTVSDAQSGIDSLRNTIGTDNATNIAVYFPRLKMGDPLKENRTEEFVPCGAIAGIYSRTDAQRGVWKAPAGLEAALSGVRELSYKLTDGQNGLLNPLGLNSLRTFPVFGTVVWGARSGAGADRLASEWKYVPIRRLALFIEESLYRGTQWAVFEPNDEPLWAQIRLNVGAFMQNLFGRGLSRAGRPGRPTLSSATGKPPPKTI